MNFNSIITYPLSGPSRASSGPGAINSTGPCVGVAAQGQEGATTNANQFRTLVKHWYSRMQPSIGKNLTSKEVLRELMNEHSTDGFWIIFCNSKIFTGPGVLPRLPPFSTVLYKIHPIYSLLKMTQVWVETSIELPYTRFVSCMISMD